MTNVQHKLFSLALMSPIDTDLTRLLLLCVMSDQINLCRCFEDARLLGLLPGLSRPNAVYASCSIRSRHSLNGSSGTSPELDLFPAFPPFTATSAMQCCNQSIRSHLY